MSTDYCNEASSFPLEVSFEGRGSLLSPTSVQYQIKDLTNNRTVSDWVEISPAPTVTIIIDADENRVYADSPRRTFFEERVVVVAANYGLPNQFVAEYRYLIKNLRGFDS